MNVCVLCFFKLRLHFKLYEMFWKEKTCSELCSWFCAFENQLGCLGTELGKIIIKNRKKSRMAKRS